MIGTGSNKANHHLNNLSDVAINASLLPKTNDLYDFGSDSLRWKDGYFGGTLTVWDLIVESGSSIHLAGATFENKGHYTSIDTNWMVEHDDQDTAFIGVYANSDGVMTHANLVLDAQGSALNLLKNSPSHPWAPYMAGIVNEDGNYGTFVHDTHDISWQHFTSLTKDEYGNITYMDGMQSLMRLTDDYLTLEDVELKIGSMTENSILYIGADGLVTQDNLNLFYDALNYLHSPKLAIFDDDPILKRGHGLSLMANVEMDFDIIHVNTPTKSCFMRYDESEDIFDFDTPVAINGALVLTEETDPIFSAWDKSTGIIITESQISDLDHFTTGDEIDPIFTAWESSFTEGSIIFSDATGLIEDNPKLFWDNVNNRFGIGLTNPARSIHLQDDNAVIRIDRDTNSPAFILARFPNNDYSVPWKAFIFGVDAVDSDNGTFHITDIHTSVSGGGDKRLTVQSDGKITIPGALDIGGIISGDGSGLTGLAESQISDLDHFTTEDETDPIFTAWDKSTGISITESQISDLTHTPEFDGDISEIFNSAGLFKIQPDVQGDVELFGDTNVDNAENSKILKMWRRAAEGNDYLRFYVSSGRVCYIHSSNKLTLQAQNPFTINSVTEDITFKVGDNAGVKKFYFQDSDNNDLVTIDSLGLVGIGTSPSEKLHLFNGKMRIEADSEDPTLFFTDNSDGDTFGFMFDRSLHDFHIVMGSANRDPSFLDDIMSFTHSFRVGIKQSDPTCELDVNGNFNVDGNITLLGTVDGYDISFLQDALDTKAPSYSPTLTGEVIMPYGLWDTTGILIGDGLDRRHELQIESISPVIAMKDTNASSNTGVWHFHLTGDGDFEIDTKNDLHTSGYTAMRITRVTTTPQVVSFPEGKFCVGTHTPSGKLTVDQYSMSAGIPALTLDQADVSEPFIEFLGGTVSTGKNGQDEYIKVNVQGNTRYLRLFN